MPALAIAIAALMAACAAGPDFVRPPPPDVKTYTVSPVNPRLPSGHGEQAQRLVTRRTIPSDWWRLFRSPVLDRLVQRALVANPTIAAADATLAQAQQGVRAARGAYAPQLDAGAAAERQKGPPLAIGIRPDHSLPTFNLYTVGATASFTPDVFGLTGRQIEQQQARAENRAYQLAAAQVSVAGNVVWEALRLASARQQIEIVTALVTDDAQTLTLMQRQQAAGKVSRMAVETARGQLENDRSLLPPLQQQTVRAQDVLAALLGRPAGAWTPPTPTLDKFVLPSDLPLSLPSDLVRQRPDILAAEARLHAASAAVGVADARMYPQFVLSTSVGTAALTAQTLGQGANLVWTLLGGLTTPIFHGGALRAHKQAAIDHFYAELALYRATVLESLSQVANILGALEHDAAETASRRAAWRAAETNLSLQYLRYTTGKVSLLDWLASRRVAHRAQLSHVQALTRRYLDSAQLMVALGGGVPTRLYGSSRRYPPLDSTDPTISPHSHTIR